MAIEYGWTGFEQGESDACVAEPGRGYVVGMGDGGTYPRSGQFFTSHVAGIATLNFAQGQRRLTTIGSGVASKVLSRVYFRPNAFVSLNDTPICGVGSFSVGANFRSFLVMNTSGKFAAWTPNAAGTYSTATLTLGVWHIAEITYNIGVVDPTHATVTISIDVFDENHVLIETVSRGPTAIATGAVLPTDVTIGNGNNTSSTYWIDFDDWWWAAADGADIAGMAFPAASMARCFRVPATAQGSAADWTGDYRVVTDAPREALVADEQTSAATVGLTTTFTHATAGALGLGTIGGVVVRGEIRTPSGGAGNEALMFEGAEYTVAIPNGASYVQTAQRGTVYPYAGSFDSAEFGARNKRGVASGLKLATSYLEVLHDGPALLNPAITGSGVWQLNIVTYTGNGGYQTITGVGFRPQVVVIKAVSSSLGLSGILRIFRSGGTNAQKFVSSVGADFIAVPSSDADGFVVGPSTQSNNSGTSYVAICIQDGGAAGYHLSSGVYVGNQLDNVNRTYPTAEQFSADAIIIMGENETFGMWRTSAIGGDVSGSLGSSPIVTNGIQAINGTGFQVGTDVSVNGVNDAYHWFALRIGTLLTNFVHVGTVTPGGSTVTVTGIPFSPVFVMARTQGVSKNTVWRHNTAHAGLNSTNWNGSTLITDGITSITADGFTGGASLVTAGSPLWWLALAPGAAPSGGCVLPPPTPTAAPAAGCIDDLVRSVVGAPAAGCVVSL